MTSLPAEQGGAPCPICLDALGPGSGVVSLGCGHNLHRSCLELCTAAAAAGQALAVSCPLCRAAVSEDRVKSASAVPGARLAAGAGFAQFAPRTSQTLPPTASQPRRHSQAQPALSPPVAARQEPARQLQPDTQRLEVQPAQGVQLGRQLEAEAGRVRRQEGERRLLRGPTAPSIERHVAAVLAADRDWLLAVISAQLRLGVPGSTAALPSQLPATRAGDAAPGPARQADGGLGGCPARTTATPAPVPAAPAPSTWCFSIDVSSSMGSSRACRPGAVSRLCFALACLVSQGPAQQARQGWPACCVPMACGWLLQLCPQAQACSAGCTALPRRSAQVPEQCHLPPAPHPPAVQRG